MYVAKRIQQHHKSIVRLIGLFCLFLAFFLGAIDAGLMWLFEIPFESESNAWMMGVLLSFLMIAGAVSLMKFSGSGKQVAEMLGGKPVPEDTPDQDLRRFRDVTTEMAIASRIPMPALFVATDDGSINAFAAGRVSENLAVCVSAGALKKLTREELQGVVAHEIAHLLNSDVQLSTRLGASIQALMLLGTIGVGVCTFGGSLAEDGEKEGVGMGLFMMLVGAVIFLVGAVGHLLGGVLNAAVSRRMEFRADAEAARLMSTTNGIVGALIKLAHEAYTKDSDQTDRAVAEPALCPLHFRAAAKRFWFDSHPPLIDRIRVLDPERATALLTELIESE